MTTHLLTGASSGIGSALAERLSARGDRIILLARNTVRATELNDRFPAATVVVADLSSPETLAASMIASGPPESIDSLIHVAGTVELGPVEKLSVAAWMSQLTTNLVGAAELTRLLLPPLRATSGQVVFVNSGAGLRANPNWSAYAASKHGLKALADALRAEEKPHGIRVTSIFPGRTATPMQEKVHEQENAAYDPAAFIDPESVVTSILTALDLPRDAEITDLSVRPAPRRPA